MEMYSYMVESQPVRLDLSKVAPQLDLYDEILRQRALEAIVIIFMRACRARRLGAPCTSWVRIEREGIFTLEYEFFEDRFEAIQIDTDPPLRNSLGGFVVRRNGWTMAYRIPGKGDGPSAMLAREIWLPWLFEEMKARENGISGFPDDTTKCSATKCRKPTYFFNTALGAYAQRKALDKDMSGMLIEAWRLGDLDEPGLVLERQAKIKLFICDWKSLAYESGWHDVMAACVRRSCANIFYVPSLRDGLRAAYAQADAVAAFGTTMMGIVTIPQRAEAHIAEYRSAILGAFAIAAKRRVALASLDNVLRIDPGIGGDDLPTAFGATALLAAGGQRYRGQIVLGLRPSYRKIDADVRTFPALAREEILAHGQGNALQVPTPALGSRTSLKEQPRPLTECIGSSGLATLPPVPDSPIGRGSTTSAAITRGGLFSTRPVQVDRIATCGRRADHVYHQARAFDRSALDDLWQIDVRPALDRNDVRNWRSDHESLSLGWHAPSQPRPSLGSIMSPDVEPPLGGLRQ